MLYLIHRIKFKMWENQSKLDFTVISYCFLKFFIPFLDYAVCLKYIINHTVICMNV